jgi:hypothetical protein
VGIPDIVKPAAVKLSSLAIVVPAIILPNFLPYQVLQPSLSRHRFHQRRCPVYVDQRS